MYCYHQKEDGEIRHLLQELRYINNSCITIDNILLYET